MTATTSKLTTNPDVLFTEIDDGTGVLLHLHTKFYYTLNTTGVFVWTTIAHSGASTDIEIADRMTSTFRVDADVALRDIRAVLAQMLADGLLLK